MNVNDEMRSTHVKIKRRTHSMSSVDFLKKKESMMKGDAEIALSSVDEMSNSGEDVLEMLIDEEPLIEDDEAKLFAQRRLHGPDDIEGEPTFYDADADNDGDVMNLRNDREGGILEENNRNDHTRSSFPPTGSGVLEEISPETQLRTHRRRPSGFQVMRQASSKLIKSRRRASSPDRRTGTNVSMNSGMIPPLANPHGSEAKRLSSTLDLAYYNYNSTKLRLLKGVKATGESCDHLSYGAARTVGRRPYQEDRFVCVQDFKVPSHDEVTQSFFGVFDGHAGDRASSYCANVVPRRLGVHLSTDFDDVHEALTSVYEEADRNFCDKARRMRVDDGTTAVTCYIRDGTIYCANAGDSRSVLSRNGIAVDLSFDHKPENEEEHRRIVEGGGFIKKLGVWRTMGVLSMSRAIGDLSLKPHVICTPEITETKIEKSDTFIVMASDGLWDVMESQDVVDFMHARPNLLVKPEAAAKHLVTEAFKRGSRDNITVVYILLNGCKPAVES